MDKAAALEEVAKDIASCRICSDLCLAATNPVPGEGNSNADIMFIGEAPGAKEDQAGRPFVGAAGKFLAEMLASIGFKREDVYITNVVKYRPPGNRDPLPEEIKECWPYLKQQIDIIEPKLLVLLGRHAMNIFLPNLKISQAHGLPKRIKLKVGATVTPIVVLPLYHPAAALYNGGMRQTLIDDFAHIPFILEQINSLK